MKAIWENIKVPETINITYHTYKKYVNLLGIIIGRMHRILPPITTAICAEYDKIGLFNEMIERTKEYDINTIIFCILMASNCSTRKLFTADSQIQGGLDLYMKAFYDNKIMNNEKTNWLLISAVLPTEKHLNLVSVDDREIMLREWIKIILFIKDQMKEIWNAGMKSASHKNMLVPRGVNSTCWNCMVGTWNNGKRHIATLCNSMNIPMIPMFKCMKCTAGDQMKWLCKKIDPDVEIFKKLASIDIYPWSGLEGDISYDDLEKTIEKVCIESNVDPIKYKINRSAIIRSENMKIHEKTICGVQVGNISNELIKFLKNIGTFGSTQWTGK